MTYLTKKHECPSVSIIIANFNGGKILKDCLNAVLTTQYPNYKVIVVDNGSRESIIEMLRAYEQKSNGILKILLNPTNLGFAEANNIGVNHSNTEYVAFLNNDTIVEPSWLQSSVGILEKHGEIGAVQSLLLTKDGNHVDSVGGIIDILGTAEDEVIPLSQVERWVNGEYREIFSVCAAAALIRRRIFLDVGGFDPRFFAYYEDVDLSWRIRLNGHSIVLDPKSIVYHLRGGTSRKFKNNIFDFHLYKNQVAMLIKNYEWRNILLTAPSLLTLYFFRLLNSIIKNNVMLYLATIKSISWNIRELPYLFCERKYVQKHIRRVGDREIKKFMNRTPLQILRRN